MPCCRVTVASPIRLITGPILSAGSTGLGAGTRAEPPPPPQAVIANVVKRAIGTFFANLGRDNRGIMFSRSNTILASKFKDNSDYLSRFFR